MPNKLLSLSTAGALLESPTHSDGMQLYHGFLNRTSSTIAFDNTTHVFTLGVATTAIVYLNGVAYTISSPGLTIDLDTKTLSNGLWFIWVEVVNGAAVLNASKTVWSITNTAVTPCATVYWNGSAGALSEERHGYDRNLQDHLYKHTTIGARIANDGSFAQTYPSTLNTTTQRQIELSGGVLWDEDIQNAITSPQTRCRLWYETSSGVWTWRDGTDNGGRDYPFIYNAGKVQYPNSNNNYTLTDAGNNDFIAIWVYASNDTGRPIAAVTTAKATAYNTLTQARTATPPSPPFSPEIKLLWRWIFKGDGTYQEAADYRTSGSLPSGGVASPTALSVSFAPAGNVAATNVQGAIEELDTEKLPNTTSLTEIAADLVDADEFPVYDASAAGNRKSLLSRIWTYIQGKLASPGPIGGTTPAAGTFTTLTAISSSNGYVSHTFENTSTGTSAVCRIQIGNNTSSGAGQIVLYGGNHSTLANYLDIANANGLPIRLMIGSTAVGTVSSTGIEVAGIITFSPGASVTPASNGQVTFELTNNTTLKIKAKGGDGFVRSVSLTLAQE